MGMLTAKERLCFRGGLSAATQTRRSRLSRACVMYRTKELHVILQLFLMHLAHGKRCAARRRPGWSCSDAQREWVLLLLPQGWPSSCLPACRVFCASICTHCQPEPMRASKHRAAAGHWRAMLSIHNLLCSSTGSLHSIHWQVDYPIDQQ